MCAFSQTDGQFFTLLDPTRPAPLGGVIAFCPRDTTCLEILLEPGATEFALAVDALVPEEMYRVIYRPTGATREHPLDGWVYAPQNWAADIDPYLGIPREIVVPTFVVTTGGGLGFRVDRTPSPVWQRANRNLMAVTSGVKAPPRWLFAIGTPLVLGGNFSSDPDALFGVESVKAGFALSASWRPRDDSDGQTLPTQWHRYFELTVAYALNRYDTQLALAPDEQGNVTFHRVLLAGGIGTMRGAAGADLGAGGVIGIGGIYDGSDVLEYDGRRYTLFGLGIYLRAAYTFALGNIGLGPFGRFEYVYYPADHSDDDFWYGGMPTLTLGITLTVPG
jgi:hypothetical protein